MSFVVDASVVVKWFVDEDHHEQARDILRADDTLLAPDLIVLEITNVVWKKTMRGEIDRAQAAIIASAILQGEPQLHPSTEFSERALEMALSLNHPIYDCVYLACAEHFDSPLITLDQRLCKAAANTEFESLVRHLDGTRPGGHSP
jgi:predicted nucleic acid-binding protein